MSGSSRIFSKGRLQCELQTRHDRPRKATAKSHEVDGTRPPSSHPPGSCPSCPPAEALASAACLTAGRKKAIGCERGTSTNPPIAHMQHSSAKAKEGGKGKGTDASALLEINHQPAACRALLVLSHTKRAHTHARPEYGLFHGPGFSRCTRTALLRCVPWRG